MFKTSTSNKDSYEDSYTSFLFPSIFEKKAEVERTKLNDRIISWLKSAIEEGKSYLKQQPAYAGLDKSLDIINGEIQQFNKTMSDVSINYTKRAIREQVAILCNIRKSWVIEPNSSTSPAWIRQSQILNACDSAWYSNNHVREAFKGWCQLSSVQGTGYLLDNWEPEASNGQGDMILRPKQFDRCLPIGLDETHYEVQDAYAWVMIEDLDIRRARFMFPQFASLIKPMTETESATEASAEISLYSSIRNAFSRNRAAYDHKSTKARLYYIYVKDYTVNPTDKPILMGEGSWQYTVPFVGQQLTATTYAKPEDCLLYPQKRLVICTDTDVLYDGTSFYWHGKFPLVKYSPDSWAFSFLGYSMALETSSMNRSLTAMVRGMDDGLQLQLDPPCMVDDTMTSMSEARQSLRVKGRKIRGRLGFMEFLKPLMQPTAYLPNNVHYEMIEFYQSKIKEITGLQDLNAMKKLGQMPSSDSLEKLAQEAGSIAEDMSLSMDKPLWELADMNRVNYFQFYDKPRRMQLLGEYGVAREDSDTDKDSLIPDYISSNQKGNKYFNFDPNSIIPSAKDMELEMGYDNSTGIYNTRLMRAKTHMRNFTTHIDPSSAHEYTNIQKQLLLLQAYKVNPLLVDLQMLAETLNIPNWGKVEGDTVLERAQAIAELQKKIMLQGEFDSGLVQLKLQELAMQMQAQMQQGQQMQEVLAGIGKLLGGEIQGGQAAQSGEVPAQGGKLLQIPKGNSVPNPFEVKGRPPSFNEAPQLVNKGDRSTITTS